MSAYRKGALFEHRVKDRLEELGYVVVRSAGSHKPMDLVAINGSRDWSPLFVECKMRGLRDFSKHDRLLLWDIAKRARGIPLLAEKQKEGKRVRIVFSLLQENMKLKEIREASLCD